MKKIIIPFFCAVLFSTSAIAQQKSSSNAKTEAVQSKLTSQQVIDQYLKALGGKDRLEAVKSTITENSIAVQGMEITMSTKKMGNKFKSVQTVMGQQMVQLFDGEKGYFDQMGKKSDIPADKIDDLKKGKTIDALGYQASDFTTVEVEKIDGKDHNVLSSKKGKFYFDASTGLLSKSISDQGTAVVKSYMTVDGLKFPAEIHAEGGGQQVVIKTTKVVINSGVSDADFK